MSDDSLFERMGEALKGALPDAAGMLDQRAAFVSAYCEQRGWDPNHITIDQLLEIRGLDGWRNP